MSDDLKRYESEIKDCLIKIEEAIFLLKDGKQIQTFNKLIGVKQKLFNLYGDIKNKNERNKN